MLKLLRMRRASVMALRTFGSMDSALKLMKQPQDVHWPWKPSRRRETLSENRVLHRVQVTLILSVMGRILGSPAFKFLNCVTQIPCNSDLRSIGGIGRAGTRPLKQAWEREARL
jgi:hypothetical protein